MLKRIRYFMLKDIMNAMRDNIIIYGALFPILLAVIMNFFIPSLQSMKLTVAVEENVEQRVINGLRQYADVEIYANKKLVQKRVEKNDDIAGIVTKDNRYVILLEGNEAEEAGDVAQTLMNMILSDKPRTEFKHINLGKTNSKAREVTGALLLLTSILIGGYIIGFNMVNEKETRAVQAISITPLKTVEFILCHTLLCLISGMVLAVISSFILVKGSIHYGQVVIAMIATTGLGMILGFIIGGLADNLISAIAVVKFAMLAFIGVPIVSLFTPQHLQWVFYLFPNYWAFQSYLNIFNGNNQPIGFMISSLMAFVLSTVIVVLLTPMLKKRLKMR